MISVPEPDRSNFIKCLVSVWIFDVGREAEDSRSDTAQGESLNCVLFPMLLILSFSHPNLFYYFASFPFIVLINSY